MRTAYRHKFYEIAGSVTLIATLSLTVMGHCDTMDGPVVKAARRALQTGNIDHVLIWVHSTEEAEVRSAFKEVRQVRRLGRGARALADKYFFETVVRLHRAGEGEPFTGLKPSGTEAARLFVEIDKALQTGSIAAMLDRFPSDQRTMIAEHFREVIQKKNFAVNDVDAGRRYVDSYVTLLHMVEKIGGHQDG